MKALDPIEGTFVFPFLTGWFTLLAISKPSFKIHTGFESSEYILYKEVQTKVSSKPLYLLLRLG